MRKRKIFLPTLGAIAGLAGAGAYVSFIRPWMLSWGATGEEASRYLPGDELLPRPKIRATHAVDIRASPGEVWPWLVQIGQGRGGFYSYDWIENLMGLDIHTADRILPEHQDLEVGAVIPLAPGGFGVPVAVLEPEKALVLHGDSRTAKPGEGPELKPGQYLAVTWGFYLEPQEPGTTRLIERWQSDWNPSPMNTVFYRVFLEPGAFLMERKMLLGIKERAERRLT